ncbi:MAG: hypothetical protein PHU85_07535, partial [Phycisphaerae bacterium]|nr:hypothetical protein [Phycisphaerae bacterium]
MSQLLPDNLVRVAIVADGRNDEGDAGAALVRWSLPDGTPADSLVQVYVNGQLAAVSDDPDQRELLVAAPVRTAWPAAAVRLVAVSPAESGDDLRRLLGPQPRGGRALLRWPRTNDAPLGATVNVFGNGGAGEIDFAQPVNPEPIAWFPDGRGKWGFALSGFGDGAFGYDASRSIGFGLGGFGIGELGFDAEWAEWLSDDLPEGAHLFALIGSDGL